MKVFDRAYQFYQGLPPVAKAIVIIGGGAVAWFGIINPIRKVIVKKLDESKAQKTVNTAKGDLADLTKSGVKATYQDSQYRGWADKIQQQFDGTDTSLVQLFPKLMVTTVNLSSSAKALYSITSQLKNNVDFLKLVTAYGVRTYDKAGWFTGDLTGDLYAAVTDELDDLEIKFINQDLTKRGITQKF